MQGPLILLLAWAASAQVPEGAPAEIHDLIYGPASTASLKGLPVFPERLTFEVSWGIITVGEATLNVERAVNFSSRAAYAVESEARSNGFCDTFYKVRDRNESWIDAETLTSLGYSKKLREGGFFRDEWVVLRDGKYVAKTVNREGNFSYRAGTAPVSVQDVLSALYFVRTQDLTPGREFILDVNTKENWPLVVKVVKKERVKTPAGSFDAILVEPFLRREGIFIQKGKRLRLWLSDDERKMPVLMKVEVFFGHVTAALKKAS